MQTIGHLKRINRDIHDLMHYDFGSGSASVMVDQPQSQSQSQSQSQGDQEFMSISTSSTSPCTVWSVNLTVCPFEGPYRGGHFLFTVNIPVSYPFVGPDVWVGSSSRPIWHPNIDLDTKRVMLPLDWSPVLTLTSLVLAIQMMMLEPSADNPLNLEACSYYTKSSAIFEQQVQRSLNGCQIGDTRFVPMQQIICKNCMNVYTPFGHGDRNGDVVADPNLSHLTEEFDMILDTGSSHVADIDYAQSASSMDQRLSEKSPRKRGGSEALTDQHESERVAVGGTTPFSFAPERGVHRTGYRFASNAKNGRSADDEGSVRKRSRVEWVTYESNNQHSQPPRAFAQHRQPGQPLAVPSPDLFRFGSMDDENSK